MVLDACCARNGELRRVLAELNDPGAIRVQDLRDQEPQLAIAQHGDFGAFRNFHLIENLARRCERLGKDGMAIAYSSRHDVEIMVR